MCIKIDQSSWLNLLGSPSAGVVPGGQRAAQLCMSDLSLRATLSSPQESIGKDLDASEAQHREVHRLMSFSTRLADLAGSKPTKLEQMQAMEADPISGMGTIAEEAGVCIMPLNQEIP